MKRDLPFDVGDYVTIVDGRIAFDEANPCMYSSSGRDHAFKLHKNEPMLVIAIEDMRDQVNRPLNRYNIICLLANNVIAECYYNNDREDFLKFEKSHES